MPVEIVTITCPNCPATWAVDSGPEGRGYNREAVELAAPRIARHMRDKHGDEETAIRWEKWVVTPPPWRRWLQK